MTRKNLSHRMVGEVFWGLYSILGRNSTGFSSLLCLNGSTVLCQIVRILRELRTILVLLIESISKIIYWDGGVICREN